MSIMDNSVSIRSNIQISTDRLLLDLPFVHTYMHDNFYWAQSLTFDTFQRAVEHSAAVFGIYDHSAGARQTDLRGLFPIVRRLLI
ncbi:hypothetical protein ACFPYJ_09280 [Paenibacillus solisilvae]|uniref:Uncharacterized protein n=1 Tax=Paenibacillus solisilvae TaxID=2486751 RepID=A0ABW0VTW5_9BACL